MSDPTVGATDTSRSLKPPEWLGPDALAIWTSFAEDQSLKFAFKQSDTIELARYCDNVARYLALKRQVGTRISYVAKNAAGSRRRYIKPEYREMVALGKELRNQASALGLNPQARLSISSKLAAPEISPPSLQPQLSDLATRGPLGVLRERRFIS